MASWWRFAAVACGALLAGCGLVRPNEPPPDPAWIAVRVYTNGGSRIPGTNEWIFVSPDSPNQTGDVTWTPEGTCILIGRVWNLQVTTQDAGAEKVLDAVANSAQFSGVNPLDVAIERDADGRVTVIEGVPDWWDGDGPIGCACA